VANKLNPLKLKTMKNRIIKLKIEDTDCEFSPISAKTYYQLSQKSIQLMENHAFFFKLLRYLEEHPDFKHPQLLAALQTLFGKSSTMYDDHKCSFSYLFEISIEKKGKNSKYLLNFTDVKGNCSFRFMKILSTKEDLEKYTELNRFYEPIEDEFSKSDMEYFMGWFYFYLLGFMESFEKNYKQEFARTLEYSHVIYGFADNNFFIYQYEDSNEDSDGDINEYRDKIEELKQKGIPINENAANN